MEILIELMIGSNLESERPSRMLSITSSGLTALDPYRLTAASCNADGGVSCISYFFMLTSIDTKITTFV